VIQQTQIQELKWLVKQEPPAQLGEE
jgi:hypothetical protein